MSDLIDRQAAIEALAKGNWGVEWDKALAKAIIGDLPSAQPTRKRGEWVEHKSSDKHHCNLVECPFCGEELVGKPKDYNFCPNCGADMRGKQE